MPDWFTTGCRWLWRPEQCTNCGAVREDGRYVRDGFMAFCSPACNLTARRRKWLR